MASIEGLRLLKSSHGKFSSAYWSVDHSRCQSSFVFAVMLGT